MTNEFLCPHCRRTLSFAPEHVGISLACPYCGQIFAMSDDSPGAGDVAVNQRASQPATSAARPGGVTATAAIGIVLAGVPLLVVTCLGVSMLCALAVPEVGERINESPALQNMSTAHIVADAARMFVLSLALLLLSIGLLKGSGFSRRWFQVLAVINVAITVGKLVAVGRTLHAGTLMVSACATTAVVVYYATGLIYLRTTRARAWFARCSNQAGAQPPCVQLG